MGSTNVNQSMMIAKNAHAYVSTSFFHESALKIFLKKSFQNFLPRGNSFNFGEKYKPLQWSDNFQWSPPKIPQDMNGGRTHCGFLLFLN